MTKPVFDPQDLRDFLVELGDSMNAAGDAVSDVSARLTKIAVAYDSPRTRLIVFPSVLIVSVPGSGQGNIGLSSSRREPLRLDQIAAVYALADQAEIGSVDLVAGRVELNTIAQMGPRFSPVVTIAGHALITVGLVLLLQPGWLDVLAGLVLGTGVGVLNRFLPRAPTMQPLAPVIAALLVSTIAFAAAAHGWGDSPLRLLIAPLVTFLPGAVLATGTMDLSAGEMIAGTGRLVFGAVQLVLLAFGIVAAAQLVGLPSAQALADEPTNRIGEWAPWAGVSVFAVGQYLYNSGAKRTFGWMLLVLYVAYAGQVLGGAVFGGYLSGFVGAFVMTPVALFVAVQPDGPPLMATFLPAFWLLIPGALGLIGVTQLLGGEGSNGGLESLLNASGTIVAIALGVLVGLAFRTPVERFARLTGLAPAVELEV